jgi:hypothetical protein
MYYPWVGARASNTSARNAAQSASSAASEARSARRQVELMEDALGRHALIIRTLLSICEKKGLFNEPEFIKLMEEVDLSDGRLDGKYTPEATPQVCPQCGKTNGRKAVTCMYCGADLPRDNIL